MPRVTVVLPAFNIAGFVRQAVESILAQTYSDFELLAFDDGSTDRTPRILQRLESSDSRLKVFLKPRGSKEVPTYARLLNEGIERARGTYIARMDADDVATPDRFEKQVAFLDEHADCTAVGGAEIVTDRAGDPIARVIHPIDHDEIDSCHLSLRPRGARRCQICHPTVMMRREAVLAVGGYREDFSPAEDYDLWLRLAEQGRLANLPEPLIYRRVNPGQVSQRHRSLQLEGVVRAAEEAHRRRGLPVPMDLRSRLPEPGRAVGTRHWIISQATHNGYWRTARKHALLELVRRPWSLRVWKLAARMSFG